ncbi:hypothetical protein HMPREF0539_0803 [Lacticaseibacillus rhamnosus LMS2-1]|uniref:Uncharacterized protein n=1 Tax=Lacticaseibacillus rhamnosus (strain LMS2-1) TaxID=525361 RepID=C2JV69_LACRM|nr:hypothetical protein HMPREF0539_0803 [Lacticaseibacillus rhamnosus LMS2-1]
MILKVRQIKNDMPYKLSETSLTVPYQSDCLLITNDYFIKG